MKKSKLVIGSPIRQSPVILREFLRSLDELDTKGLEVHYCFVDDNDNPESVRLLEGFAQERENVRLESGILSSNKRPYIRNDLTHYWGNELVWRVAGLKNRLLEIARQIEADYLFLIDSDLLLHPATLQQLICDDQDIVANIFWTRWEPDAPEMPQVWLADTYNLYLKDNDDQLSADEIDRRTAEFLERMRKPGLYQVGGLGACTLIRRKVLEAGVNFDRVGNISFWGEDRHFCVRAAVHGFSLFVDTHYPAYHLYRESDLRGVDRFRQQFHQQETRQGATVSLCMIVKDEEQVLARCLASVKELVDEIIIVDTGSSDQTRVIAEKFGAKVYDFEWVDDFAAARNYAFSLATQEYQMWLDADDTLEAKDSLLLLETLRSLDASVDSVTMPYHLGVDDAGKATFSFRRNRIVRRACGFRWHGAVHEYLEVNGKVIHCEAAVTHKKEKQYTDRNLQIYRRKEQRGDSFSVRDLYYFGNELRDNAFYEEAIVYYEKFLATGRGWVEDKINACLKLSDCYLHLHEKERALQALFHTMVYDLPRAEACCRIGNIYYNGDPRRAEQAIFWYKQATQADKPDSTLAFMEPDAWTWLPHLQLCLCYDHLGQYTLAEEHNNLALAYNPTHPSMLYNKSYYEKKFAEQKKEPELRKEEVSP